MGVTIQIPDATFTNYFTSLTLPNRTNLVGEYILGGTQAASTRNRANPAAPASVINSPTYKSNYVTISNTNSTSNGFNTGLQPASSNMFVAVSAMPTGPIAGNDQYTPGQVGLTGDNSGNVSYSNGWLNGALDEAKIPKTPPASNPDLFFVMIGWGQLNVVGNIIVYKSGVRETDAGTATHSSFAANNITIGGQSNVNWGGNSGFKCAYVAVFDRLLTGTAEADDIYTQLKDYFTSAGLNVS